MSVDMTKPDDRRGRHQLVNGSSSRGIDQGQSRGRSVLDQVALCVGAELPGIGMPSRPIVELERLAEALSFLGNNRVAAVVADLELPDSGGLSTFQRLLRRASPAPIIILVPSTRVGWDLGLEAVQEGATAFLPRDGLTWNVLGHLIESVIAGQEKRTDLVTNEDRLRIALDGAGDGLWDWNLETGEVFFSARCNTILGFKEEESVDSADRWLARVHPDDLKSLRARLDSHFEGSDRSFEFEHRIVNGFGETRWILARGRVARDLDGDPIRMAGFMMDVTDRRRQEDQAIHRALHDELTGLANRGLFLDRVGRALAIPERDGGGDLSVLFIDLDHFKTVNDTYGHGAGDQVLIEVARRLESVLRPGDTVARLGGDEFGILLANVRGADLAIHVADRILDLVSRPISVGRNALVVHASIGIAVSDTGYAGATEIIDDADLAMYRAKSLGRSRYQVCNPVMHERALSHIKMESELRKAVDWDQFEMHYQPIVDLQTGGVAGIEAMVRWRHPDRGILTPAQFIGVAEASGLIVPLGWRVLEKACEQLGTWSREIDGARYLFVSVNVSPRILLAEETRDRLEEFLSRFGLDPDRLVLEFPEAVILNRADQVGSRLVRLRELGVRLAIDDFGSDFASIRQLDRMEFDLLKLDPSITRRARDVAQGDRLPQTLIRMAEDLGFEVVAEGVELAEQLESLREMGCRMAQGFWFASPAGSAATEEVISEPPEWWSLSRQRALRS